MQKLYHKCVLFSNERNLMLRGSSSIATVSRFISPGAQVLVVGFIWYLLGGVIRENVLLTFYIQYTI